jgi:hypothetical protein
LSIPDASRIHVIVEADFGRKYGFGWPDAVVIVETPTEEKLILFIEAKAGLYQDSALPLAKYKAKGFNSSINGQLSLRYRLAQALKSPQKYGHSLVEPKSLAHAYGEPQPRRLANVMSPINWLLRNFRADGLELGTR